MGSRQSIHRPFLTDQTPDTSSLSEISRLVGVTVLPVGKQHPKEYASSEIKNTEHSGQWSFYVTICQRQFRTENRGWFGLPGHRLRSTTAEFLRGITTRPSWSGERDSVRLIESNHTKPLSSHFIAPNLCRPLVVVLFVIIVVVAIDIQ